VIVDMVLCYGNVVSRSFSMILGFGAGVVNAGLGTSLIG
jgi:hypothetical protein